MFVFLACPCNDLDLSERFLSHEGHFFCFRGKKKLTDDAQTSFFKFEQVSPLKSLRFLALLGQVYRASPGHGLPPSHVLVNAVPGFFAELFEATEWIFGKLSLLDTDALRTLLGDILRAIKRPVRTAYPSGGTS